MIVNVHDWIRRPRIGLPPETETAPVQTRDLTRVLNDRPVLDQIELTIMRGEIVALTGANGAGKTTLLRCLAGQLRPSSGEVLWFGTSRHNRTANNRLIGFAAHEQCFYGELTAAENLLFAARMHGLPNPHALVAAKLSEVGLERRAGQAAGTMSKGMKQRLALARAFIHDPPIVILDEPFAGLDATASEWLESWIIELRREGRALCFTSHETHRCDRLADRSLELRNGVLR